MYRVRVQTSDQAVRLGLCPIPPVRAGDFQVRPARQTPHYRGGDRVPIRCHEPELWQAGERVLVRDFRHLSRHLHHGTAEGLVDSFLSDFNINQTLSRPSLSGWSRDSLRKSRGRFQNLIGSPQLSVLTLGTFDLSVFRTHESQALSDINQRLVHTGTASTPPIPQAVGQYH